MPAVQISQTYHHRRVKDYSCKTYVAVAKEQGRWYLLYSENDTPMMRRHLSPASWHKPEKCPYG